jgi:hypothetical protein
VRLALRLALLVLAACTTSGAVDGSVAPDARPASDARPAPDARPAFDAGPAFDAAPADAGALPPRYTTDRTYSPITAAVAANLRAIAARNGGALQPDVFMKVGDSITADPRFLTCFSGGSVDLGDHADLMSTLTFFEGGDAAGSDPFARTSLAAVVGWSADAALAGDPDPLDQEEGAIQPRYAVVMFGSNDVVARSIFTYEASLLTIVDDLAAQGVVPILSSIPPQTQTATGTANVPRYNAVSRGIAAARLVPYMDYWREMEPLPNLGLGGDGLHPDGYPGGACLLTTAGLQYGYNVRNLLTLASLARTKAVVDGGAPPDPEPSAPAVVGAGSYDAPFVIDSLPFTDLRDTSRSMNTRFTTYTGCSAAQDESGPEYIYRLDWPARATLRAYVLVRDNVDIDLHLLSGLDVADCLLRNDKEIVVALDPGTYYLALDTYVPADGVPRAGEYLVVVLAE